MTPADIFTLARKFDKKPRATMTNYPCLVNQEIVAYTHAVIALVNPASVPCRRASDDLVAKVAALEAEVVQAKGALELALALLHRARGLKREVANG